MGRKRVPPAAPWLAQSLKQKFVEPLGPSTPAEMNWWRFIILHIIHIISIMLWNIGERAFAVEAYLSNGCSVIAAPSEIASM
jgi:hypothetical protein